MMPARCGLGLGFPLRNHLAILRQASSLAQCDRTHLENLTKNLVNQRVLLTDFLRGTGFLFLLLLGNRGGC